MIIAHCHSLSITRLRTMAFAETIVGLIMGNALMYLHGQPLTASPGSGCGSRFGPPLAQVHVTLLQSSYSILSYSLFSPNIIFYALLLRKGDYILAFTSPRQLHFRCPYLIKSSGDIYFIRILEQLDFALLLRWLYRGDEDSSSLVTLKQRGQGKRRLFKNMVSSHSIIALILQKQPKRIVKS
jgi:hypothetical protein